MHLVQPDPGKRQWKIRLRLPDGRVVKIPGDRDEDTARRIGDRIEALVRAKANGESPPPDLRTWIENMPESLAKRLIELGLLDLRRREQGRPIGEQIDDFVKVVSSRKTNSHSHAVGQGNRVRRIFRELKLMTFSGLTADAVLVKIAEWGVSVTTRRHYLVAAKDFAKWMVKSGRATTNPLADTPIPGMYVDPEIERVPLTVAEFKKLMVYLDGFEKYPHQIARWTASHRKLLYWVAVKTAFRKSELKSLKVSNLQLNAKPPNISIKARNAKNKKAAEVPIPSDLAAALRSHVRGMERTDKLFCIPSAANSVVDMFRKDLDGAGIPWALDDDETRDFHTLRTTAISWWLDVDNLSQKRVQILARLNTLSVVEKYSRNLRLQEFGWLNKGPKLVPTTPK